ncbi:MAG: CheR family methyltransferase [Egibacteraceae bacterium]
MTVRGLSSDLDDLELTLLLEAIYQHYGYDFRQYARAPIRRRVWRRMLEEGLETVSGLQERVLHGPDCMQRLLVDLSVTVTSMFRDPTFRAGGRTSFSDYYRVCGSQARFDPTLADHVVCAQHNLACDGSFNQFHLIVCRNVMIYFGPSLQDRVHNLFYRSLVRFGLLALGQGEAIRFTRHADAYEELDCREKLYRRVA